MLVIGNNVLYWFFIFLLQSEHDHRTIITVFENECAVVHVLICHELVINIIRN